MISNYKSNVCIFQYIICIDIRIALTPQPWVKWMSLGVVLIFCGMWICLMTYRFCERQTEIMYEQQQEYEQQIAVMNEKQQEYEQQMNVMNEKEQEYKRQIAVMNEQQLEYKRQMNVMNEKEQEYKRQIAIMNEKQQGYKIEVALCERNSIISKQLELINRLKLIKCETQRSIDDYIAKLEKYFELKAIDDSWTTSLSEDQRNVMHELRNSLGLDEDMEIPDVKDVTAIVQQASEEILMVVSSLIETLQDALEEMDIEKMRQLQKEINIKQLSSFLKMQFKQIKLKILSSSDKVQRRGILYQISVVFCDYVIPVLSNIAVSVVTKILSDIMLWQ